MELGGKCYIKCEKSGYHATVEFHCKVTVIYPAIRQFIHLTDMHPFIQAVIHLHNHLSI